MDEIFLSYLLSTGANYATEMSVTPITWAPERERTFNAPTAFIPSGVTPINAVSPTLQVGPSWMDSSVSATTGFIPLPHLPDTSPRATISTSTPSPVATCRISSSVPCDRPLDGTLPSIRRHLSMHGHRHHGREMVGCPWIGCSDRLQWMNVPRHIRSIHLGVRTKCPNCKKSFTRPLGLAKHLASEKCSVTLSIT